MCLIFLVQTLHWKLDIVNLDQVYFLILEDNKTEKSFQSYTARINYGLFRIITKQTKTDRKDE